MKCNLYKRNARPNNNQLITHYQRVRDLLRIQQYPVNNTYNIGINLTSAYSYAIKISFLNARAYFSQLVNYSQKVNHQLQLNKQKILD